MKASVQYLCTSMTLLQLINKYAFLIVFLDSRTECRSLSNLVCSVLRKALPQSYLPVNSLYGSIPFPLETFLIKSPISFNIHDTESEELLSPNSDTTNKDHSASSVADEISISNDKVFTRNSSEPSLVEVVKGFESFRVSSPSGLEDPLTSPSDCNHSSLSWFVDINENAISMKPDKQVDLSCFDKFFPEFTIFKDPKCFEVSLKPKASLSLPAMPSYVNKEEVLLVPRSPQSSPDFKLYLTESVHQTPLGCLISSSPPGWLESPVVMVINDYLSTIPKKEVNFRSAHSSSPCKLRKPLNRTERYDFIAYLYNSFIWLLYLVSEKLCFKM